MPRSDWKFLFGGLILVVCAGTVVCALSGSGRPLLGSNGSRLQENTAAQQQAASPQNLNGIQGRASDAANRMPLEWPAAESVGREVLTAADDAKDLQARFEAGAAELLPTMVAMNSPKLLARERKKCADAFGKEINSQCKYTITSVMERSSEGEAIVVFSRATLHDGSADECKQFVGCVTKSRVGTKIPVPTQSDDLTAFSQHIISKPAPPHLSDPVELKKLMEIMESDMNAAREQGIPADDYKLNYSVLHQGEVVDYMKERLEELAR